MISALALSQVAKQCEIDSVETDISFRRVSTDSRAIARGDLFVAIRGERFDGHNFIAAVGEQGACAAIVEQIDDSCELVQLEVKDSIQALGQIAVLNRLAFSKPVVGITGSTGKTTVKEMVAAILSVNGSVLATRGNLNNHIGVPLMLLDIEPRHDYAVIEMGASAVGEIAYLASLAKPDVSVINNISEAHVEGFGSLENIVIAKSEIYEGLADNGIAIVNLDDVHAPRWLAMNKQRRVLTFSRETTADITAQNLQRDIAGYYTFDLVIGEQCQVIQLPLLGEHNVSNALAAAACCHALDVAMADIQQGLESVAVVAGRMQRKPGAGGSLVIDDTYNANPASVRAAIDVLAACSGKRVLVLGDMAELGEDEVQLHREVGEYVSRSNIDVLLTVGQLSRHMGGRHSENADELLQQCLQLAAADVTFLVKGSRSSRMEVIVDGISVSEGE